MSEQLELPVEADSLQDSAQAILVPPSWFGLKQQIYHLAQFGGSVQVVCGEKGSGKSTFLEVLCGDAEGLTLVGVANSVDEGVEALLVNLLGELGIRVASAASMGELIVALRSHVQSLEKESARTVVAIDDAHYMDDSALAALVSVLQGSQNTGFGLHLILLGEPGLAERIDQLHLLDVSVNDATMPNFSPSELKSLLYEGAHLKAPLPVEQVQKVWVQSGGLPGVALEIAAKIVEEKHLAGAFWAKAGWPYSHAAALGVLLVVLVWAMMVRDQEAEPPEHAVLEPRPENIDAMHSSEVNQSEAEASKPGVSAAQLSLNHERAVSKDGLNALKAPNTDNNMPAPVGVHENIVAKQQSGVNLDGKSVDDNVDSHVTESNTTDAPEVTKTVSAGSVKPVDEVEVLYKKSSPAVKKTVDSKPKPKPQVRKPASFVELGESTLLALPENGYVLQLMATSALASLERYVSAQSNSAQLQVYQAFRKGKRLYILVEGFYADKHSAQMAIANLPENQRKGGPWPKRVSQIHQEIRQYRAK